MNNFRRSQHGKWRTRYLALEVVLPVRSDQREWQIEGPSILHVSRMGSYAPFCYTDDLKKLFIYRVVPVWDLSWSAPRSPLLGFVLKWKNFKGDLRYFLPVKFGWNPFSGLGEVENEKGYENGDGRQVATKASLSLRLRFAKTRTHALQCTNLIGLRYQAKLSGQFVTATRAINYRYMISQYFS